MWYHTKATKILGIKYPILQGPFGGNLSTVDMVAKVSNLGGLGGYGAVNLEPSGLYELDKKLKRATDKPYNLNLWVSDSDAKDDGLSESKYEAAKAIFKPYFDEVAAEFPSDPPTFRSRFENQLQAVLDIRPKVFSFMFGLLPADVIEECHKRGMLLIGVATTLDEGIALDHTGVDMIVASGFEAGGHRASFLDSAEQSLHGTFVLTQLLKEKVKVPVIAAGGIANGKGIAAAMTLGADAVQIGTAFLACDESGALPAHKAALFSDAAKYTMLTRAFSGRLGRGLTTKIGKDLIGEEAQLLPYPLQSQLMGSLRKAALEQQKNDMVMFWGGQITPLLRHKHVASLMQALIEETKLIFGSRS